MSVMSSIWYGLVSETIMSVRSSSGYGSRLYRVTSVSRLYHVCGYGLISETVTSVSSSIWYGLVSETEMSVMSPFS